MSEEIKIIDGTYKKDDPHKDIGKQKFRVRKHYTAWVEYEVVAKSKEEAAAQTSANSAMNYSFKPKREKR